MDQRHLHPSQQRHTSSHCRLAQHRSCTLKKCDCSCHKLKPV